MKLSLLGALFWGSQLYAEIKQNPEIEKWQTTIKQIAEELVNLQTSYNKVQSQRNAVHLQSLRAIAYDDKSAEKKRLEKELADLNKQARAMQKRKVKLEKELNKAKHKLEKQIARQENNEQKYVGPESKDLEKKGESEKKQQAKAEAKRLKEEKKALENQAKAEKLALEKKAKADQLATEEKIAETKAASLAAKQFEAAMKKESKSSEPESPNLSAESQKRIKREMKDLETKVESEKKQQAKAEAKRLKEEKRALENQAKTEPQALEKKAKAKQQATEEKMAEMKAASLAAKQFEATIDKDDKTSVPISPNLNVATKGTASSPPPSSSSIQGTISPSTASVEKTRSSTPPLQDESTPIKNQLDAAITDAQLYLNTLRNEFAAVLTERGEVYKASLYLNRKSSHEEDQHIFAQLETLSQRAKELEGLLEQREKNLNFAYLQIQRWEASDKQKSKFLSSALNKLQSQ